MYKYNEPPKFKIVDSSGKTVSLHINPNMKNIWNSRRNIGIRKNTMNRSKVSMVMKKLPKSYIFRMKIGKKYENYR